MLVDLELKAIAQETGHLCPELAIGWRVGLYARRFMAGEKGRIEAGCLSCAMDALEAMGPWELSVDPLKGRHVYLLEVAGWRSVVLEVAHRFAYPDEALAALERRIAGNHAEVKDMVSYQAVLDRRIQGILSAKESELFSPSYPWSQGTPAIC